MRSPPTSIIAGGIQELTIAKYHSALRNGNTNTTAIVSAYLAQINQHNPTLNALITVNPNAVAEAKTKDDELAHLSQTKGSLPPLHGVPIILKDTYTTAAMRTTSGIQALRTLQTTSNASVVDSLLANGAIILAKANLHEFSLEGVTVSSLQGQTLNPYDLTRTPGGSSGGTAAALSANMGLVGCGGDTMNSLRSPASACGIVGFRPTTGQISRRGIVPVSETQDVAGPMGRTIADVRVLFNVMRGEDALDPVTLNPLRHREPVPVSSPVRRRIGILKDYFGDTTTPDGETIHKIVAQALQLVQAKDETIELVDLPPVPEWDIPSLLAEADTQPFEFQTAFDAFLQSISVEGQTPHKSLASIVSSGEYHHEAVTAVLHRTLQGEPFTTSSSEYRARLERIKQLKRSVESVFEHHRLDAVVYPHQKQLVTKVGSMKQPGRNGLLASLSGRPAVCFPAGFSPPSETAEQGIPVGIELMGQPWQDDELLNLAEQFEKAIHARNAPSAF